MGTDWILNISVDILAILIPALIGLLFELIRKRLGEVSYRKLIAQLKYKRGLAWTAVTFVEQVSKVVDRKLSSKEKFDKAAQWLETEAKRDGISLTSEQIEGLIEAAVGILNGVVSEEINKELSS